MLYLLIIQHLFLLISAQSELQLVGAGASLPGEVYEAWAPAFESFRNKFVDLDNEYYTVGSGTGQSIMLNEIEGELPKPITYCGSDSELTEGDYDRNPNLQMLPVLAGSVVLAYNLNINPSYTLNLTMDHVIGIYNGSISLWNDSSIEEINPNIRLPNAKIRVIARADDSGSTEIFTATLSAYSEQWNDTYGTFSRGLNISEQPINWEPDVMALYGRTNRGMSGIILSYRNAIGYVSIADVVVSQLRYARIWQNDSVVDVQLQDYVSAMDKSLDQFDERFNAKLSDFTLPGEYPFIGYSYFIVNMNESTSCNLAVELVRYLEWIVKDDFARNEVRDFMIAPITQEIGNKIVNEVLKKMTCEDEGLTKNVYELVEQQKYEEWKKEAVWRIPLFIFTAVVIFLIILLLIYIIWQQVRLRKAILSDEWKIDKNNVNINWTRKLGVIGKGPGSSVSLNMSTMSHMSTTANSSVYGIGVYKQKAVCLREIKLRRLDTHKKVVKKMLIWMRDNMQHNNVLRLYGIVMLDSSVETFYVSDYCPKGTLSDVVQNDKYRIDDNIKFSLAMDITSGMSFLHGHGIIHSDLNSENCFIDHRWNVKVAGWEDYKLEAHHRSKKISKSSVSPYDIHIDAEDPNIIARQLLWKDPDILIHDEPVIFNKQHDMYSFALVLVEIFTREDPFSDYSSKMEPVQILQSIKMSNLKPDLNTVNPKSIRPIIASGWNLDITGRPSFGQMNKALKAAKASKKGVLDSMMEVLESYANHLEEKVAERTLELDAANSSLQNLLHQILPPSVADSLSRGESIEPEVFESVSIYFSDIVGFTKLSASSTPQEVVNLLNDLYTTFDSVLVHHDVYKVETIGDAYMVVSGLPKRNGHLHAAEICTMSLDLIAASERFIIRHKTGESLQLRAGIHSGSVVAGVVGLKMPRYCLFGDTVNTASRMESNSVPMHIQVSQSTHALLQATGAFNLDLRGELDVKGKGSMKTYFLKSKIGYTPLDDSTGRVYCTTYLRDNK